MDHSNEHTEDSAAMIAACDSVCEMLAALERICQANSAEFARSVGRASIAPCRPPPPTEATTVFHSRSVPPLSLGELAVVMRQATGCDVVVLEMAGVLLRRLFGCCGASGHYGGCVASMHSVHRAYITCLLVVMKVHCDGVLSNVDFAARAGVSPAELCRLEWHAAEAVGWRFLVTQEDLNALAASPSTYFDALRLPQPNQNGEYAASSPDDAVRQSHAPTRSARSSSSRHHWVSADPTSASPTASLLPFSFDGAASPAVSPQVTSPLLEGSSSSSSVGSSFHPRAGDAAASTTLPMTMMAPCSSSTPRWLMNDDDAMLSC